MEEKVNNITINLTSLVDYIRDKDVLIDGLRFKLEEYKRLCADYERVYDKIKEYIEHENFKRNILLGISEKKYTRDILNHILEMIEEIKE